MLAQAMPRPIMGTRVSHWLVICDRTANDTATKARQPACTALPPKRMHNGNKNKAEIIVTKLYVPFIRPLQPAASSYSGASGVAFQTDSTMLTLTYCQ